MPTIPVIPRAEIPNDVRVALAEFRNALKRKGPSSFREFKNVESHLPSCPPTRGRTYYKCGIGRATAPTSEFRSLAGKRRLVVELDHGNRIRRAFFTGDHYGENAWYEIRPV